MTTLATGLIGAAVGGVVGAPGIGFSLGAALGQSFLGGKGQHTYTRQEGSRLSDLKVQSSQVGVMIPIVYGIYRIAGNLIWSTDIFEHSNTTTQTQHLNGGGKGGHHHDNVVTQTITTYRYSISFALGLCQGVIFGIRRIWADGKLIYNTSSTATTQTLISSQLRAKQLRLYKGTEDQLPDPLMEAHLGAGFVPAFRGLAYLVFEDLQLAEFGNRLPNITVEVVQLGEHIRNLAHETISIEKPLTDATGQFSCFDGGVIHTKVGGEGWPYPPERVDLDLNLNVIQRWRGANTQTGCTYQPIIKHTPNLFLKKSWPSLAWYDVVTGQHAPIEPYVGTPLAGVYVNGQVYCLFGDPRMRIPTTFVHYHVASPYEIPKTVISKHANVNHTFGQPQAQLLDMDSQHSDLFVLLKDQQNLKLLAFDPVSSSLIKKWNLQLGEKVATPLPHTLAQYDLSLNSDSTCAFITHHNGTHSQAYLVPLDRHADTLYADPNETYTFEGIGSFHFLSHDIIYISGLSHDAKTTKARIRGIHAIEPSPLSLAEAIEQLCQTARISSNQIDLSKLHANPQKVIGFVLSQSCLLRDALLTLQQAYHFDIIESGFTLQFIPRGKSEPININGDEIGTQEYGQTASSSIIETHSQTAEFPQCVNILFTDSQNDYQQGHQSAQRRMMCSHQSQTIEFPLALTQIEAAHIADSLLYEAWTGRIHYEFTLPRKYAFLDPADVVTIKDQTLRLISVAYGDPGLIKIKAVREDTAIYEPVAVCESSPLPVQSSASEIQLSSPTQLYLLDIPILQDADDDTGFYACVSRLLPEWPGAIVAQSVDNGQTFKELYSQTRSATVGIAQNALPASTTTVFDDENVLFVKLTTGELSSTTEMNLLNGANACLVGQEILQFQYAVLQADGSYRLSRFLRGRRGTEGAVNTHQNSELFILIDPATLHRVKSAAAEIGLSRIYKAITLGRSISVSSPYSFTNTAIGKKPLSPVHLQANRNEAGDLILNWIPRTRIQSAWRDGVDAPPDPEIKGYEIDILKDHEIVRTLATPTENITYTADQQIIDFGSIQTKITASLCAIGKTIGRGFPAIGTL